MQQHSTQDILSRFKLTSTVVLAFMYHCLTNILAKILQAFVNIVLTLCDAQDSVVMFAPYYFNSYMSFQMTGVTDILVGPGDPNTLYPDAGQCLGSLNENSRVLDDGIS